MISVSLFLGFSHLNSIFWVFVIFPVFFMKYKYETSHVFYNLETIYSNPDSPKYHNYDQLSKQSLALHSNFFDTSEERKKRHVFSRFDGARWHFQNCTQIPTRRQPAIHHRSRGFLTFFATNSFLLFLLLLVVQHATCSQDILQHVRMPISYCSKL